MLKKLLLAALFTVLAAIGYLAYARTQGAALPGLPLPAVPAALATAAQAGDSTAVAAIGRTRCRLLPGARRRACYEDFLLQLVREGRIRVALGALNLLGQEDADIRRFGHDYSHVIGINAWAPGKDIGQAYVQCSELYQSGCYHGVIQAFFAYEGTDSAKVAALCRDSPDMNTSAWLHFQCVHGIGHGLVQNYTMNLPLALSGCDMLGNSWDAESCYGGAFMEFIVGGRGQSHHPHLAAHHDSAAAPTEHDHMAMVHDSAPPFKVRDKTNPLYPCSVLDTKYQRACYQMQAGLVVEQTGLDFAKVAAVCDMAPEPMKKPCYQGIGTYVSGVTSRDAAEATRLCMLGSARWRPWCFVGVVKNFVDVTANPDDGLAFCRGVEPVEIATGCYHAVGEEIAVLYPSMEKRREVCKRSDVRYVDACLYGTGLIQERPADLPKS